MTVGSPACSVLAVGDCAGSMADVFESIAAEILGTMILGADLAKHANLPYCDLSCTGNEQLWRSCCDPRRATRGDALQAERPLYSQ